MTTPVLLSRFQMADGSGQLSIISNGISTTQIQLSSAPWPENYYSLQISASKYSVWTQ